jgi:hypothetical protein
MEADPSTLDSLRKAVETMPDDLPLRVHLALTLMRAGLHDEAIRQAGAVLQRDPANREALALVQRHAQPPGPTQPVAPEQGPAQPGGGDYDWAQAESEVQDLLPPMFVSGTAQESIAG